MRLSGGVYKTDKTDTGEIGWRVDEIVSKGIYKTAHM